LYMDKITKPHTHHYQNFHEIYEDMIQDSQKKEIQKTQNHLYTTLSLKYENIKQHMHTYYLDLQNRLLHNDFKDIAQILNKIGPSKLSYSKLIKNLFAKIEELHTDFQKTSEEMVKIKDLVDANIFEEIYQKFKKEIPLTKEIEYEEEYSSFQKFIDDTNFSWILQNMAYGKENFDKWLRQFEKNKDVNLFMQQTYIPFRKNINDMMRITNKFRRHLNALSMCKFKN